MKNIILTVFILLVLVLSINSVFAQYGIEDESKEISREIKKNQQQIKKIESQIKKDFEQMRQDALRQKYEQRDFLSKKAQADRAPKDKDWLLIFSDTFFAKIPLILVLILLLLIILKVFDYEAKTPQEAKNAVISDDVLVQVDKWTLEKTDLADYLRRLDEVVDKKVINIYSDDFCRSFVMDTLVTEVLFWSAVDLKVGDSQDIKGLLVKYEDFLLKLDPAASEIRESLSRYNARISKGDFFYVQYYRDFLNILLIIGSRIPQKSFELYSRYLFVEKLIAGLTLDLHAQDAPEKVQAEIDLMVAKFSSKFQILARAEKAVSLIL